MPGKVRIILAWHRLKNVEFFSYTPTFNAELFFCGKGRGNVKLL